MTLRNRFVGLYCAAWLWLLNLSLSWWRATMLHCLRLGDINPNGVNRQSQNPNLRTLLTNAAFEGQGGDTLLAIKHYQEARQQAGEAALRLIDDERARKKEIAIARMTNPDGGFPVHRNLVIDPEGVARARDEREAANQWRVGTVRPTKTEENLYSRRATWVTHTFSVPVVVNSLNHSQSDSDATNQLDDRGIIENTFRSFPSTIDFDATSNTIHIPAGQVITSIIQGLPAVEVRLAYYCTEPAKAKDLAPIGGNSERSTQTTETETVSDIEAQTSDTLKDPLVWGDAVRKAMETLGTKLLTHPIVTEEFPAHQASKKDLLDGITRDGDLPRRTLATKSEPTSTPTVTTLEGMFGDPFAVLAKAQAKSEAELNRLLNPDSVVDPEGVLGNEWDGVEDCWVTKDEADVIRSAMKPKYGNYRVVPVHDEVIMVPVTQKNPHANITAFDMKVELKHSHVIAETFKSNPINLELHPTNGIVTIPRGTPINHDMAEVEGLGLAIPAIRTVVSYQYKEILPQVDPSVVAPSAAASDLIGKLMEAFDEPSMDEFGNLVEKISARNEITAEMMRGLIKDIMRYAGMVDTNTSVYDESKLDELGKLLEAEKVIAKANRVRFATYPVDEILLPDDEAVSPEIAAATVAAMTKRATKATRKPNKRTGKKPSRPASRRAAKSQPNRSKGKAR